MGSCTATPDGVEQMLKFAAENEVRPIVEKFPFSVEGVSTALKRLEGGEMRYRGVLVV